MNSLSAHGSCSSHVLRFQLLSGAGTVAFPCDAAGRVDLDSLSEKSRRDYLFARATAGRMFGHPDVQAAAH